MTDLARAFATAAATTDPATRLQRFTEITNQDESACDAWVGLISCGQTDRATLFRAWFSRKNFGRLADAADLSIVTLKAQVPIGGPYADLQAPVASVHQLCVTYALTEAAARNYTDAVDALEPTEGVGMDDINTWALALVHAYGQRWDTMIDILNSHTWRNQIFAGCAELLRGVAAAHLGLWVEAERRITTAAQGDAANAVAKSAAWHLGMIYRHTDRETDARTQLEFVAANWPDMPEAQQALNDPSIRLPVTTREQIASRTDPWNPDTAIDIAASSREQLLHDAQARLDRTIGLTEVKEQVQDLWADAEMAVLRAERNLKVTGKSRHMVFAGPPGTGKTTIAAVVADIYAGLGIVKTPKLVSAKPDDMIDRYLGHTGPKTNALFDRALDGVLLIDEAYGLVQRGGEHTGGNQYGHEAITTMLARLENDRDRIVVIIAGYNKDIDRLLDANEGLRSRFATRINFPGYTPTEIVDIAVMLAGDNETTLTDEAADILRAAASELADTTINGKRALDIAGNGRYARTIVEKAEYARNRRLSKLRRSGTTITDDMLRAVEAEDMNAAIRQVEANIR